MTSRRKTFIVPKVGCQNTCKASFAGYFNIADSLIKNKVQNICWYYIIFIKNFWGSSLALYLGLDHVSTSEL